MIVDSTLWIQLRVPDGSGPNLFRDPALQLTRSSVEQQSDVDACNQRNIEQQISAPAYAERFCNHRREIREKNEDSSGEKKHNRE